MALCAFSDSLLKIIVLLQVILTTWCLIDYDTPPSQIYVSTATLIFAAFSVNCKTSTDSLLMYCVINGLTIIHDILLLASGDLYVPILPVIIHMLCKPVFCILLSQIYRTRGSNIAAEYDNLIGTVRAQTNSEYESIDETQRLIGSTDDITETDGLSNLSNSAPSHDVFSSTI